MRGKGSVITTQLKQIRRKFEKGEHESYFQISINDKPLFQKQTLDIWLNGIEYHQDQEKAQKVKELEKALTQEIARGIFISQLSGRVSALHLLAELVRTIVGKVDA